MAAKVKHGKRLYKQMALEVAVRNPERYYDILKTFSKFEGQILTDEIILNIYSQLYIDGVLYSDKLQGNDINTVKSFVRKLSHNNEWGFPTGYQAAFTRYLKTLSELGFIYAQYNECFLISDVAKAVISDRITLSESFALQCMRFWRKSPYRRVLNDFNFFQFIIEVIDKLNRDNHRLSYIQFMVALFSDTGNVDEFIRFIRKNKIGNDKNKAYELVEEHYNEIDDKHGKIVKIESSFGDYGNTVFRVLQLTGFITVEYIAGNMFLSINNNRQELYNKLKAINFTISETEKEDCLLYFKKLSAFPINLENIILGSRNAELGSVNGYNEKLFHIVESYQLTKENVSLYLKEMSEGKKDRRMFWFIQEPVKFEFLITILLYLCYGDNFYYKPNYKCDNAGIPYSHAPGNIGDIEVFNGRQYWLIEATLIRNKNQQLNNETVNLFRHISSDLYTEKYLTLVAPYIHEDTRLMFRVATVITMLENKALDLYSEALNTDLFISETVSENNFSSLKNATILFIKELQDFISARYKLYKQ